jgi:two-component system chemotaxis response regulator CheB
MIKCRDKKPAVLMCSSLTVDGSIEALKALKIGAVDFIAKDPQVVGKNDPDFQRQLLSKLRAIGGHRRRVQSGLSGTKSTPARLQISGASGGEVTAFEDWKAPDRVKVVVIGSSTGGPPILEKILSNLPNKLSVPILVAQHMPKLFTASFAERLNKHCSCGAMLAEHGTGLDEPKIYISEGGKHLKPTRVAGKKLIARTIDEIDGAIYKPSVDLLFSTAAELFGPGVLAIQLTGMGEDGAAGAKKVHDAGGRVLTQNAESCVVYGMPRAVVENGVADSIFTPEDLQKVLQQVCQPAQSGGDHRENSSRMSA